MDPALRQQPGSRPSTAEVPDVPNATRRGKKPDTPCAGCGKLLYTSPTSLPAGQRTCWPCRREGRGPASRTLAPRPCAKCEQVFAPRSRRQRFCSVECGGRSPRGSGPKVRPIAKTCAYCSTPFGTSTPDALTCSHRCAAKYRAGHSPSLALVLVPPSSPLPARHPARRPLPPGKWWDLIVNGPCKRCGREFTAICRSESPAFYCSGVCAKADARDRRRAAKRNAYVADVNRRDVYERDGWRCQLCRRKVNRTKVVPHPKAPTLDHIIPLALGGKHEPANVQLACFQCNVTKSHRGVGEQLRLIG